MPVEAERLTESWGGGERFGLVDIGRGRTYWFATKNAAEGESDEPGGRKARFGGASPAGTSRSRRSSAPSTGAPFCATTTTSWNRFLVGATRRVVLVGDAAHAARPASDRARRRRSKMPSCSPTSSSTGTNSRPRSPSTRRSADRGPKPSTGCPAAPTRQPSSPTRSDGVSGDAVVRRLPERAQRRQLEPLVRYEQITDRAAIQRELPEPFCLGGHR